MQADSRITLFADIILPLALDKCYTYRVPYELNDAIQQGQRVVVQFGQRRVYAGIVLRVHNQPPQQYTAKYLLGLLDEYPLVSAVQLQFWQWMASYYLCNLGDVMQAALPAAFKLQSETVLLLNPDGDPEQTELDEREKPIINLLLDRGEISIKQAAEQLDIKSLFTLVRSLYTKGLVLTREEISETYKPKKVTMLRLAAHLAEDENALSETFDQLEKRAVKQLDALMQLISKHAPRYTVLKSQFISQHQLSSAAIDGLVAKGILETYTEFIDRIQPPDDHSRELVLSPAQEEAAESIRKHFEEKDVVLLHGITSSGKTQVYTSLIQEVLDRGQQVLYLVPEIALTTQLIRRIQEYFGSRALVTHSRFNEHERVEIWQKTATGEAGVILGARSALFMPFHNLGLVIVDEEHESSYKQMEPAPRYHARDAAIYLAHLWKCKTLLGSATPSLESYYNATEGKYGLVQLRQRYADMPLPPIEVADMAEETRTKKTRSIFSSVLMDAVEQALAKQEQVILFHNRKGYIPVTICAVCGWSPKCINCDITLTYYKHSDSLHCHYCGFHQPPVSKCGACGSTNLHMLGYGTERIEDELKMLLPHARIARFDTGTARTRQAHQQMIHDLESGKTDILVGTQMISKGLDFENVSLVGIVHADQMLNFPDFRAFERSFQMMEQVAGRAGRHQQTGKVILQTFQPEHRVIHQVMLHDYDQLYQTELDERRKFNYPPFTRLVRITLKHKDLYTLDAAAQYLEEPLRNFLGPSLLGPESPYVSRIRNYYLKQFLVKIDPEKRSLTKTKNLIKDTVHTVYTQKRFSGILTVLDVDPM